MNPLLRNFYQNEKLREEVRQFMIERLGVMAIERAFAGEDTSGIKEARECVEKTFDKLEELYSKKEEPVINNSR